MVLFNFMNVTLVFMKKICGNDYFKMFDFFIWYTIFVTHILRLLGFRPVLSVEKLWSPFLFQAIPAKWTRSLHLGPLTV